MLDLSKKVIAMLNAGTITVNAARDMLDLHPVPDFAFEYLVGERTGQPASGGIVPNATITTAGSTDHAASGHVYHTVWPHQPKWDVSGFELEEFKDFGSVSVEPVVPPAPPITLESLRHIFDVLPLGDPLKPRVRQAVPEKPAEPLAVDYTKPIRRPILLEA